MPKLDFYIKCMGCNATRKLLSDANGGKIKAGTPCPLCEDGYHFAGINSGQAEKLMVDNARLRAELATVTAELKLRKQDIGLLMAVIREPDQFDREKIMGTEIPFGVKLVLECKLSAALRTIAVLESDLADARRERDDLWEVIRAGAKSRIAAAELSALVTRHDAAHREAESV